MFVNVYIIISSIVLIIGGYNHIRVTRKMSKLLYENEILNAKLLLSKRNIKSLIDERRTYEKRIEELLLENGKRITPKSSR